MLTEMMNLNIAIAKFNSGHQNIEQVKTRIREYVAAGGNNDCYINIEHTHINRLSNNRFAADGGAEKLDA